MQSFVRVIVLVSTLLSLMVSNVFGAASFTYGPPWWGGGFQGKISFSNDSGSQLSNWEASFNTPFEITSLWGAKLESEVKEIDGSRTYKVSGESWNNVLASGAVVEIGFTGKTTGPLSSDMVREFSLDSTDSSPPTGDDQDSSESDSSESDSVASVQSSVSVTSDWGSGFGGKVDVPVESALSGWTLEFDFNGEITSIWNAKILSHIGSSYKIGPLDWNVSVPAGGNISFGFNGSPGNVNTADFVNVALNGNPVSESVADDGSADSGSDDGAVSGSDDDVDSGSDEGTVAGSDDDADSGSDDGTVSGSDDGGGGGSDDGADSSDTNLSGDDNDSGITGNATSSDDNGDIAGGTEVPVEYAGNKIVGYFAQWGIYGRDYQVADIPGHKLTHINYAFVGIDGTTLEVKSVDKYADFEKVFPADNGLPAQTWDEASAMRAGNFGRMRQLKQKYPHLKLMLSVGGWTLSTFFSDVALSEDSRARFAASAVHMMVNQGFDGIDLDWEYPVSGGLPAPLEGMTNEQLTFEMEKRYQKYRVEDRDNYVLLLQELRKQLDEKASETGHTYLLTIAAPAGPDKIANYDLENMVPYLDFINLMTYDFHGGWDDVSGHQAAMQVHPGDNVDVSVQSTVADYLDRGVPAQKLVVGMPFYGRAWEGVQSTDNGLYQPAGGIPAPTGPGHWEAGVFDYWLINNMLDEQRSSLFWDEFSMCSYAYGSNLSSGMSGGMFITFDDVRSVRNKAEYIKSLKLGGAMFWELSGDVRDVNSESSLLGALAASLIESGSIGTVNGTDSSDSASAGSGTESNSTGAGAAAAAAPAKPSIAWVDPQQTEGDYTISWNMWWGDNGVRWVLFENGEQVHSSSLEPNTPQAQSGSVHISGRESGEYSYMVRLYGLNGEYSESDPVSLAVGVGASSSSGSVSGLPAVDAGSGSRYTDDRDQSSFVLDTDLAFQIHVNENQVRTFTFDKQIERVLSRNPDLAEIVVAGASLEIKGREQGRTGLRIDTTDGKSYFTGLRVDSSTGELPGMPAYLAVGSVSEDTGEDLSFWQNMGEGQNNRRMDIRYIYINGGPINGWTSWGADRARKYARESLKLGIIPFFVFYNIPDGGESYYTDLEHIQDQNYMDAYYSNLEFFLSEVASIMKGELYGIILEPDFLGYMQQNSGKRSYEIGTTDGTVVDTVKRINSIIAERGGNVVFGWQLNLWARAGSNGGKGLVRRTDEDDWAGMDWNEGRDYITQTATEIAAYAVEAGVLSHGADFLSIDKYGLDAGIQNPDNPAESTWFWNADHWSNYLLVVEAIKRESGLPVVLWQIPVGHINSSTAKNAVTGEEFPALSNTHRNYEDSATTWFLGDTFRPGDNRKPYFLSNRGGDSKLSSSSDSVTWGSHMEEIAKAGAISVLFGAGVGQSTDGVGSPPSDDGFWIQKVQDYYLNGPVELD